MSNPIDPFVGPRPFTRNDERMFFGRNWEAVNLEGKVLAHPIVVLYAKSGVGKSSLVEAGLAPRLERGQWEVMRPARVGAPLPPEFGDVENVFVWNALMSWGGNARNAAGTISDYLGRNATGQGRVLIFDQFEECFTSYPYRGGERREFFEQIQHALSGDRQLRVLFALREEYLAELETCLEIFPPGEIDKLRLERLSPREAMEALTRPFEAAGKTLTDGAARKLLEHLTTVSESLGGGRSKKVEQDAVEPMQLQVVCRDLWLRVAGAWEVSEEDVEAVENSDPLAALYDRAVARVAAEAGLREGEIRRWFGQALITPAGTRATVFEGEKETAGLPNRAVQLLSEGYLIRSELRGGGTWHEISHDLFLRAIQSSNQAWEDRHANDARYAKELEERAGEWLKQVRPPRLLLDENETGRAERWLESDEAKELGFSSSVKSFVQESRVQRGRLRERARRQRWLVGGLVVIVLVVSGIASEAIKLKTNSDANAAAASLSQQKAQDALALEKSAEAQFAMLSNSELATQKQFNAQLQAAEGNTKKALEQALIDQKRAKEASAKLEAVELANQVRDISPELLSYRGIGPLQASLGQMATKRAFLSWWTTATTHLPVTDETKEALRLVLPLFDVGTPRVPQVQIAPDGKTVGMLDEDGSLTDWDVEKGSVTSQWGRELYSSPSAPATPARGSRAVPGGFLFFTSTSTGTRLFLAKSGAPITSIETATRSFFNIVQVDTTRALVRAEDWRVYDFSSGEIHLVDSVPLAEAQIVALDPADREIIGLSKGDGSIRIWNLTNRTEQKRVPCQAGSLRSLTFSGDGKRLLTVAFNFDGQLIDANSGSLLKSFNTPDFGYALSDDARYIARVSRPEFSNPAASFGITVVNTATDESLSQTFEGGFSGLVFETGRERLVVANSRGDVYRWDVEQLPSAAQLQVSTNRYVRFGAFWTAGLMGTAIGEFDDPRLATVSNGRWARSSVNILGASRPMVTLYDEKRRQVVTASHDDKVEFWDASSGKQAETAVKHAGLTDMALDPRGDLLVTSGADGSVRIWDRMNGAEKRRVFGSRRREPTLLAFSPDGELIAGGGEKSAFLWSRTGSLVRNLGSGDGSVMVVAFAAQGKQLLTSDANGQVHVWDVGTGRELQVLGERLAGTRVWDIAVDSSGQLAGVSDSNKLVRIYNVSSGREVASFSRAEAVRRLAFSPDSKWIASVSERGNLRIDPIAEQDLVQAVKGNIITPIKPADCPSLLKVEDIAHACPPPEDNTRIVDGAAVSASHK